MYISAFEFQQCALSRPGSWSTDCVSPHLVQCESSNRLNASMYYTMNYSCPEVSTKSLRYLRFTMLFPPSLNQCCLLVTAGFLAKFFLEVVALACFLGLKEKDWHKITQLALLPKVKLSLTVLQFLVWYFNHYTKCIVKAK